MGYFNWITGKKNAPPTTGTPTSVSAPQVATKPDTLKAGVLGRTFTRGLNYVPAEEVSDFAANTTAKRLSAYLNKSRMNNAKLADKAAYINTEFDYEDVVNNAQRGPSKVKKTLRARFYGRNNANAGKTYRNFKKTLSNSKKANYNKKNAAFKMGLQKTAASASKSAANAARAQAYAAAGREAPQARASLLASFTKKANTKANSSAFSQKNPMVMNPETRPLATQSSSSNLGTLAPAVVQTNTQKLNAQLAGVQTPSPLPTDVFAAAPKIPVIAPPPVPGSTGKQNFAKKANIVRNLTGLFNAPSTAAVPPPIPAAPPAGQAGGKSRNMSRKQRRMKKNTKRQH